MSSPVATRPGTPDLATAMRDLVLYRQEHLTGDEKGEGQIFLEHLFQAFEHAGLREVGAVLEARMRRGSGRRRTPLWPLPSVAAYDELLPRRRTPTGPAGSDA